MFKIQKTKILGLLLEVSFSEPPYFHQIRRKFNENLLLLQFPSEINSCEGIFIFYGT